MIIVEQWTGHEAVLLQSVMRKSVRDYAAHLGISPRTVTKWRKNGADLVCTPEMQQILDAALATCTPEEQAAFRTRLTAGGGSGVPAQPGAPQDASQRGAAGPYTVVSHKFLPAYVGEPLTALWGQAQPSPAGPGGLERRTLTVEHPTSRSATLYLYACGIAMLHLDQPQKPDTLTDLAVWRYRTYLEDRAWAGELLARLLAPTAPDVTARGAAPEYVLSVYELGAHSWTPEQLTTAMQLLATPSVLVDRRDPTNIHGLDGTEQQLFDAAWEHPDAVEFSGAISMGLAGWSGVAYHPQPGERALTTAEIIDLELDVQALWALSTHVQGLLTSGQDRVMPQEYGHSFLAAAYARLTQSGPVETVQHRLMRKAILATSELPERLKAAQEALRP